MEITRCFKCKFLVSSKVGLLFHAISVETGLHRLTPILYHIVFVCFFRFSILVDLLAFRKM